MAPEVTVCGTAERRLAPDAAELVVSVTARDAQSQEAAVHKAGQLSSAIDQIIEAARHEGNGAVVRYTQTDVSAYETDQYITLAPRCTKTWQYKLTVSKRDVDMGCRCGVPRRHH